MAARFITVSLLCLVAPSLAEAAPVATLGSEVETENVQLLQTALPVTHKAASPVSTPASLAQQGTKHQQQEGVDMLAALQQAAKSGGVSFGAMLAEYIAMTLFVAIGCGSAMGIAKEPGSAWVLQVSLTFGLAITSLAYAVGAYSGGQINCAVTLGLVLVGEVSIAQGILNVIAQLLGSVTGAYILCLMIPKDKDLTQGLGSNAIGEGFSINNAFLGEAVMTFVLVFVVLETAVNPNSLGNRELACVAIGFAVFLAHTVLIPIDGCSINPTRSFGPAYVAKQRYAKSDAFKDMHVFVAAPLVGATLAALAYAILRAV